MNETQRTRASKFLSLHLRHAPHKIGLQLDAAGWTGVEALLQACARAKMPFSRAELDEVVRTNSKQRFAFDASGQRIRANQGHSVAVDLGLPEVAPPATLFHGTAERFLDAIRSEGLKPMARHHVHLSGDEETARQVGARHGGAVVLRVPAGAMHAGGQAFFRSENGVWLCERVAPEFLELP